MKLFRSPSEGSGGNQDKGSGAWTGGSDFKSHSRRVALERLDQMEKSVAFIRKILPDHYVIQPGSMPWMIHCTSPIGVRKSPYLNTSTGTMVNDAEDEEHWEYIMQALRQHFKEAFQEVNHATCFCHVNFTIFLKHTWL